MRRSSGAAAALLFGLACTWVPLSEQGKGVRLAQAAEVSACENLGRTTSLVADHVGFMARSQAKMKEELANLARNEAARMGGDTVVAESPIEDGRQDFGVYRCRGS